MYVLKNSYFIPRDRSSLNLSTFMQVVRRAGLNRTSLPHPQPCNTTLTYQIAVDLVDKVDQMIGSYGPSPNPVVKRFETSECPSGILARSGSYSVRSRSVLHFFQSRMK